MERVSSMVGSVGRFESLRLGCGCAAVQFPLTTPMGPPSPQAAVTPHPLPPVLLLLLLLLLLKHWFPSAHRLSAALPAEPTPAAPPRMEAWLVLATMLHQCPLLLLSLLLSFHALPDRCSAGCCAAQGHLPGKLVSHPCMVLIPSVLRCLTYPKGLLKGWLPGTGRLDSPGPEVCTVLPPGVRMQAHASSVWTVQIQRWQWTCHFATIPP
eukprot:1040070-Pelagomonas_calceolata.AAC.7